MDPTTSIQIQDIEKLHIEIKITGKWGERTISWESTQRQLSPGNDLLPYSYKYSQPSHSSGGRESIIYVPTTYDLNDLSTLPRYYLSNLTIKDFLSEDKVKALTNKLNDNKKKSYPTKKNFTRNSKYIIEKILFKQNTPFYYKNWKLIIIKADLLRIREGMKPPEWMKKSNSEIVKNLLKNVAFEEWLEKKIGDAIIATHPTATNVNTQTKITKEINSLSAADKQKVMEDYIKDIKKKTEATGKVDLELYPDKDLRDYLWVHNKWRIPTYSATKMPLLDKFGCEGKKQNLIQEMKNMLCPTSDILYPGYPCNSDSECKFDYCLPRPALKSAPRLMKLLNTFKKFTDDEDISDWTTIRKCGTPEQANQAKEKTAAIQSGGGLGKKLGNIFESVELLDKLEIQKDKQLAVVRTGTNSKVDVGVENQLLDITNWWITQLNLETFREEEVDEQERLLAGADYWLESVNSPNSVSLLKNLWGSAADLEFCKPDKNLSATRNSSEFNIRTLPENPSKGGTKRFQKRKSKKTKKNKKK
jgi:hypothetical protein